ncbi:GAF domain-containing protein [bacterium]|nr:GAF domain-containing protein [bacterium]
MIDHKVRVLLIEDNPGDARLIEEYLKSTNNFTVFANAQNLKEGIDYIQQDIADILLLDLNLPDSKGLDGLLKIREIFPELPIVILTGLSDENVGMSAVKAGAQDYLVKDDVNEKILQRTLDYAVERAESKRSLEKHSKELELLYTASKQMSQSLLVEEIYRNFYEIVKNALTYARLDIFSYQGEERQLDCVFLFTDERLVPVDALPSIQLINNSGKILDNVIRDGEPLLVGDLQTHWKSQTCSDPTLSDELTHLNSVIIVPMCLQGKTIGIARLFHDKKDAYTNEDLVRFDSLVSQMTVAVNNAHLYRESQLHAHEMERLSHSLSALLHDDAPNIQVVGNRIVNIVLEEFSQSNCSLFLVDPKSQKLNKIAAVGSFADEVRYGQLFMDGKGIVPLAIRSEEIVNMPAVHAHASNVASLNGAKSEIAVPLFVGDEVIGVIDVQSESEAAFRFEDERLLMMFAERAAMAIENARLFEEAHHRLQQMEALRTIELAIIGNLQLDITLNISINQAINSLDIDAVEVLLIDNFQNLHYTAGQGFRTGGRNALSIRLGEGISGSAALERQTKFIQNINEVANPTPLTQFLREQGFVSLIAHPLVTKGELVGILNIYHYSKLNPDADWWAFLESLAGQVAIAIDNAKLVEAQKRSKQELQVAYEATLEGWVRALDMRDKETEGHTQRVTKLTIKLAKAMGVSDEVLVHLRRGALLHDIGKMGIPDKILHKPGKLTDEEWKIMKLHPVYAKNFLEQIDYLAPALDIPYSHHEKWDGSGYPEGLKGEQIPFSARLFAVVDVWDALNSDRPYQNAWPREKVVSHIRAEAGTHFDPEIVETFLNIIE